MATYKLTYFGITGLGEPIRVALTLAGIPFEDDKLGGEAWGEKKKDPKYANCQMPIFEITEGGATTMMTQSRAILRYIGQIGKFQDKPLYPQDPMSAFYCDEVIEMVEDFRPYIVPTVSIADQAEKEAARAALVQPDGKMYPGLKRLNDRLAKFPFAAGNDPTIADFYAVCVCYMFQAPTFFDGFPANSFEPFPNIVALKNKLMSLPPLVAYYKDADGCRASFKVA